MAGYTLKWVLLRNQVWRVLLFGDVVIAAGDIFEGRVTCNMVLTSPPGVLDSIHGLGTVIVTGAPSVPTGVIQCIKPNMRNAVSAHAG